MQDLLYKIRILTDRLRDRVADLRSSSMTLADTKQWAIDHKPIAGAIAGGVLLLLLAFVWFVILPDGPRTAPPRRTPEAFATFIQTTTEQIQQHEWARVKVVLLNDNDSQLYFLVGGYVPTDKHRQEIRRIIDNAQPPARVDFMVDVMQ